MKNIVRFLTVSIAIFSLNACSFAPGIPGLKSDSSINNKPQKQGVDYKLVVIDATTIRKQKPFDYISYVRDKKREHSLYLSKSNSEEDVRSKIQATIKNNNPPVKGSSGVKRLNNNQLSASTTNKLSRFEGISSKDNKANYQYYLGKGDALNITVWDHPELTKPSENNAFGGYVIGNDGRFYFPYTGKINAVGKTIRDIREELEKKLKSFITKPQVSVSIANFRSQKIYTSGAVAKPTSLVVDDTPMTIRDAISKSGGLKPNQYTGFAALARGNKNISIDLNRMLRYNDNRQNFILKDGDRLNIVERTELDEFNRKLNLEVQKENTLSSVKLNNEIKSLRTINPISLKFALEKERSIARLKKELEKELRSEQAKVFVMGEVSKPGSIQYQVEDGMTLAEAINDAGSFKEETINPKGIFVIRKENVNDQIPTVYQLPLASVQSLFLAEQFVIKPRDIIYATASPSIRWNRILALLIPSLALYNSTR